MKITLKNLIDFIFTLFVIGVASYIVGNIIIPDSRFIVKISAPIISLIIVLILGLLFIYAVDKYEQSDKVILWEGK